MLLTLSKAALASLIIVTASWLSGRKPELAGFITALPLVSILAIAFSYVQYQDQETTVQYAKSIIFAVPISWLFFAPFFFIEKWNLHFWIAFGLGICLIIIGYFIHSYVMKLIG